MASLGNDLAQIRKKRNLTLSDLQEATKIPKRILRSIEDESIFTDFQENPTYIRSYIRSYAKALSIDDEQIIHALNKRENNDYSGSLQHIAGISSSTPESDDEDEKQETKEETSDLDEIPPEAGLEDEQTASSYENSSGVSETSDRTDVRSVNWAEMGQQFQPLKSGRSKIWFSFVVVLLIALGGSFFYFFNSTSNTDTTSSQNNNSNQESTAALSTDSLELNITPSEDSDTAATESAENNTETETGPTLQNETLEALPDTLDMVVYAAYGKLEPVRVYTDIMEDTNPYWIEQGDAVRFDFVNEIRIRGQYSNIALMLNGHVIQDFRDQFYNPETRLVEINRSYFEGNSRWLEPAPDSLEIDAPPPSVIRERPTYN